jgi:hypothetical protein
MTIGPLRVTGGYRDDAAQCPLSNPVQTSGDVTAVRFNKYPPYSPARLAAMPARADQSRSR